VELRARYYEKFPYKSVKDSWYTEVNIINKAVTVYHRQTEQSKEENVDEFFEFDWDLTFEFTNTNLDELVLRNMGVADVTFHSETTNEKKLEMQTTFTDVSRVSGSFRTSVTSVEAVEILNVCLTQIRKSCPELTISDNDVFGGIRVTDLLECLNRTLISNSDKLSKVVVPITPTLNNNA